MSEGQGSMIVPRDMTNSTLTASNIVENDYPVWSSGTFAKDDRVIVIATHSVYQCVNAGSRAITPQSDPDNWVRFGATNKWRPFDGSVGQSATRTGSITYTFTIAERCEALALVGLKAATAQVVVKNASSEVLYDQTKELLDVSTVTNFLDLVLFEAVFEEEQVFQSIPAYIGYTVELTLDAGSAEVQIGEIVLGLQIPLGEILDGTKPGFKDFTLRTVDAFGNITLVVRPIAQKSEWVISFQTLSSRRIQKALISARGKLCFFYAGDGMGQYYINVFGVAGEFEPELSVADYSVATLPLIGVS